MRRAAQRVAVLQAVQRRQGCGHGQILTQPGGDLGLARMRLGGEQALVEVFRVAFQRHHVERGNARGQLQQVLGAGIGQAGQGGHHCGAVHQRQGFLRAQGQRRPTEFFMHVCRAAPLALVHHLALAAEGGGDVGQRGQVAAGTDRTFFRDQRQHIEFEKRLQAFQQFHAHPGHTVA